MFQSITQIIKNKLFFHDSKWRRMTFIVVKKHLFYSLTCLHSFATENKRESHKKVCKNKNFYNIVMPSEDTKILEFNQYQKSHKPPFIV